MAIFNLEMMSVQKWTISPLYNLKGANLEDGTSHKSDSPLHRHFNSTLFISSHHTCIHYQGHYTKMLYKQFILSALFIVINKASHFNPAQHNEFNLAARHNEFLADRILPQGQKFFASRNELCWFYHYKIVQWM